jgi:PAS domain S-box-containing protein
VNTEWQRCLQWPVASLLGQPLASWTHPDEHEVVAQAFAASEPGQTSGFRARFRTAAGHWVWLGWRIRWADGHGVATVRDVSDEVEVRTSLEDDVRLWSLAGDVSNVGYWVVDLQAQTVTWSPVIYTIHGLDPASHTPSVEHGIDAYHPDDRERVARVVGLAAEEGKPFDFELRLVRPDGSIRDVVSSGRPHLGPDGRTLRIIGIFRDVTEERAQGRAAAHAHLLAESNAHLERFACAVSHDLKAPLRQVRLCIDWITEDDEVVLGEDARENFAFIHNRVGRLERMIDGVLAFSRASGQRSPASWVPLKPMLEQLALILPGPIAIGFLPDVYGDAVQVERVFQNLLSNAFTHGATKSSVHELDGRVMVDDDGPGIPVDQREAVFDLFSTLQPKDQVETTGVGLSIVRALMTQLGGRSGSTTALWAARGSGWSSRRDPWRGSEDDDAASVVYDVGNQEPRHAHLLPPLPPVCAGLSHDPYESDASCGIGHRHRHGHRHGHGHGHRHRHRHRFRRGHGHGHGHRCRHRRAGY